MIATADVGEIHGLKRTLVQSPALVALLKQYLKDHRSSFQRGDFNGQDAMILLTDRHDMRYAFSLIDGDEEFIGISQRDLAKDRTNAEKPKFGGVYEAVREAPAVNMLMDYKELNTGGSNW